ncbi:MAG: LysM peptidoglycan-binding domain-containing protein [Candidatus Aenigmarchaeota archaeon]|nr:LysM peptidoglycan-binding domain-containing protein [Candidatus Aenigmarchaeota archaeon]
MKYTSLLRNMAFATVMGISSGAASEITTYIKPTEFSVKKPEEKIEINLDMTAVWETRYHIVVEKGDYLDKIGKKIGFGWPEIYRQNRDVIGDNPDMIFPGQELVFEPEPHKRKQKPIIMRGDISF